VYRVDFRFTLDFLVTYAPFLVIAVPELNERKSVPLWETVSPVGQMALVPPSLSGSLGVVVDGRGGMEG
jgi:hypothetical protein